MPEAPAKASPEASTTEDWVNRTTAILAILAALSSSAWGAANLKAILEQGKVNDGWAYYQAKSIKYHLADEMADLGAALSRTPAVGGASLAEFAETRARERADLDDARKKIQREVKGIQVSRDLYVERSFWFEIGFVLLQVAVVICTIAAAMKSRMLWLLAVVSGLGGLFCVGNAYAGIVKTPDYARKVALADLETDVAPKKPAGAPEQRSSH